MNRLLRAVLLVSTLQAVTLTAFAQSANSKDEKSQDQNNSTAATTAEPGPSLDEVTVTGFRAAAERAQDIKRMAPTIVEAITLEDLGKFTDTSVSDALARVPGVNVRPQLQPNGGTDVITLRGLSGSFVKTTINGREILGTVGFFGNGSGRDLDFGAIPSEILSGVIVYKTASAELVEPGIAGEIDAQTLRPLNYKGEHTGPVFGSVSIADNYDTRRKMSGPRFSAVLGVQLFDNTFGAYIAPIVSREHSGARAFTGYPSVENINVRNSDGSVSKINGVDIFDGYSPVNQDNDIRTDALSTGIQWRPTDNLDINADFTYDRYRTKFGGNFGDYYTFYAFDINSPTTVFEPGSYRLDGSHVTYYDTSGISRAPDAVSPYAAIPTSIVESKTRQMYGGINIAWKNDSGVLASLDYSHGENSVFETYHGPYIFSHGYSDTTIETGGLITPAITFANPAAVSDVNNYIGQSYWTNYENFVDGKRNAVALNLQVPLATGFKARVGTRYDETNFKLIEMTMDAAQKGYTGVGYSADASDFAGNDTYPFVPGTFPHLSYDAMCAKYPTTCALTNSGVGSAVGDFPLLPTGSPGDVLTFKPNASFDVAETKTAFFVEFDGEGKLHGHDLNGNAGVRVVRVTEHGIAFQGETHQIGFSNSPVVSQSNVRVEDSFEYWRALPSLNVNFNVRDNLVTRFGVSRTMSLADYHQLAPLGAASIFDPDPRTGVHETNTFQGGNTELKPTMSWNYDIVGEYYTKNQGSFVMGIFYKQVEDLITNLNLRGVTLPNYGSELFNTNQPVNADKAYTDGIELSFNQPLTMLPAPWDGFGLQGNYYYVYSKLTSTLPDGGTHTGAFPNVSKNNVNGTAYYEKYGWGARLSVNYRSTYLVNYSANDLSVFARPETSVDMSLSRRLFDNFEVLLTGSNIFKGGNQEFYSGSSVKNFYSFAERPTSYTLALRAKF